MSGNYFSQVKAITTHRTTTARRMERIACQSSTPILVYTIELQLSLSFCPAYTYNGKTQKALKGHDACYCSMLYIGTEAYCTQDYTPVKWNVFGPRAKWTPHVRERWTVALDGQRLGLVVRVQYQIEAQQEAPRHVQSARGAAGRRSGQEHL